MGDIDPSLKNNEAIRLAAGNGRLEVVKILLKDPRVDPSDNNNHAIRYASANGLALQGGLGSAEHVEVVKVLLADRQAGRACANDSRVDPTACNNSAIGYASANGLALRGELGSGEHTKVVELLKAHQKSKQEQIKSKTKKIIEIDLESVKNITYKTKDNKQMMVITYK